MRIAYVARINMATEPGVLKKVESQIACWRAQRQDVRLYVLNGGPSEDGTSTSATEVVSIGGGLARGAVTRGLVSRIADWRPDLVYLRFCTYQPGFGRLFDKAPVIVEIQADDKKEIRLVSQRSHLYNVCTRRLMLRDASGLVFVTNELSTARSFCRFTLPRRTVIANGISLGEATCRSAAPDNSRPRLFFMGSPGAPWHGTDKIGVLAARRPEWDFDIVGASPLVGATMPPNVTTHGVLPRSVYEPLLHSADVAISTLALHRDSLAEASPLKTREYLAAGVPTITAYADTDFPDGAPFLLQLPNREDNVLCEIDRIDEFVARMRGTTVPRERIAHLDWTEKEGARLAFFRDVLNGPDGRAA